MSATRGTGDADRDALDRYYTPAAWADAVVSRWRPWLTGPAAPRCVLDPSVGRGAWSSALRRAGYTGEIVGVDLDPDAPGDGCDRVVRGDFADLGPSLLAELRPGLIVGNPPYRHLDRHASICLASDAAVSFLVRTAWLQSVRVGDVLGVRDAPSLLLACGRLAFDSPGKVRTSSDSADYAQVNWRPKGAQVKPPTWELLAWKPARRRASGTGAS